MAARPDSPLAGAALSDLERRVVERIVARLRDEIGGDLRAVWLYGSRARGERPGEDSDIDLLVIAEGGDRRHGPRAHMLAYRAAQEEGESPVPYAVHVHDPDWLRRRREIDSFFIQAVDRDKLVLYGSGLQ